MREQFLDRRNSLRLATEARESHRHTFEKFVGVAQEEIVLIAKVRVESRATDSGPIQDILNRDLTERFFDKQFHQRIA
jgi:hypothetical protein